MEHRLQRQARTDSDLKPAQRFATFACEKRPAVGSRAMVVTNHPLASAAGVEVVLGGGNAIDAAVASLFALTVVEPMMVGVLGGGIAHICMADGRHVVLDALGTAPAAAHDAMYETVSDELPRYRDTAGRANAVGPLAVAVPGALAGWCHALDDFGTLSVADVTAPAVRLAERGFEATPYLADCVQDLASDLACDPGLATLFLPGGAPLRAGHRVVQPEYAETLRAIARDGAGALYAGELGDALMETMARTGGLVGREDLDAYRVIERAPIRGTYRGFEILGPPPPASSGMHVVQMLNLLEGFDVRGMGFGSPETLHLLAEVMKIAFADRAVATADPAFVDVPVKRLTDKGYAEERRRRIDPARARRWEPGVGAAESESAPAPAGPAGPDASPDSERARTQSCPGQARPGGRAGFPGPGAPGGESSSTTHVTVADADGNVVATTQTINGLFGACMQIPGTGMIANNYMFNFDPHPGRALSVEAGKRVFTSHGPDDGAPRRTAAPRARSARRTEDISLRPASPGEPSGPRHDAAGGGRGAPSLDRGRSRRAGRGVCRRSAGRARAARPRSGAIAAHRGRHERHRVRRRRDADRRRPGWAGGRHAGRHRRGTGQGRRALLQRLSPGRSAHDRDDRRSSMRSAKPSPTGCARCCRTASR